jgi:hypothetical protein
MITKVPHFSFCTVLRCSAIRAIRLMMICIRSWISKTQQARMKNRTGTLGSRCQFPHCIVDELAVMLTLAQSFHQGKSTQGLQ